MRVVGLTGSIACGKSTVSRKLTELGAVIIDGDIISRRLTAPEGPALPGLRQVFGSGIFHEDGTLNRRALGQLVFGNPEELKKLDDLLQPLLREEILKDLGKARSAGAAGCVLDMPLLFEKDLDSLCDSVWCVWLPRQEQLRRLMLRDGFTLSEAEKRVASQLSADEKAARSRVVIDNRGSMDEVSALIPALWQHELDEDRRQGGDHGTES